MDIAAVDIETSDPGLKTFGAGAIRGYGEILTVGVYCPSWGIDGWYTWEQFCEDEEVLALMADPDVIKVFHNGVYDMNWLQLWGEIEINNIDDTMTRETLLDAYAMSYSLDACCQRRGVTGKNKGDTIDAWWLAHGGKGKAIEHLKDIPVEIVGKYNIQDCHATYDLFFAQQPLLEQQDLVRCNDIERKLYPWLMMTKQNGMRMDIKKRQELSRTLEKELDELEAQFKEEYGEVNVGSYIEMEKLWKRLGIPVVYSDTGRPSFSHDVLADTEHPVAALILHIRGLDKLLNTFVDGQFVDLAYRGRLHPDLYPALRDEGGTVTGRFSSRNPNGQNIPARGDKHGEEIRSLFIPEDGCLLGAFDYKQIEYRVFTHFAYGPGAEEAQAAYWDHPVDYHQMVQEMMGWVTGDKKKDKEFRHVTKNLNFTCRSTDSYFATRRGYIKAIDLVDTDRLTMDSGEWRAFIGRKQQYRILLSNGQEHKVTHDHPFKFFGKKVGASELKVGDAWEVVPCTCFGDYQTETITVSYHRIPRTQEFKIDENAAYIIGLWLGDGSLHIQYKTGLPQALSFCTDPEHTNYVIDLIGLKPIFTQRTDTYDIWYVSNKFLATWFNDNCGRTKDKHIPDVIYRSPRSVIIALLKGFLDSDGTVHNKRPQLVNTSESLMRQLARCMAMVGWEARMSSEAYHTVTPQGKEYHGILYRLIPHRTPQLHKEFQGVLRKWDEPQEYHSAKSPITIVSIEDIGEQDTMCISLPDPHWYEAECCINHNSIYGLGWRSFAERFKEPLLNAHPGWPKEDVGKLAKMLLEQYFDKIPFVRPTCQLIQQTAQRRGYVKTVSGRRQRFPPDNKAYKMVNYLIQGSAGDIMKKAIVDAWDQGVWDVLKPHMMVHDELVFSIPKTREGYEACVKLKECMVNAYQLKIPLGVDTEIGPDWGHCNEENWKEFEKQFKEVTNE